MAAVFSIHMDVSTFQIDSPYLDTSSMKFRILSDAMVSTKPSEKCITL